MDLSAAQRNNNNKGNSWKKNIKYYNCNKNGHLTKECRAPKKELFQPYPKNPSRTGYDTTRVKNISGPPNQRTIAVGYRSNSKLERKAQEQLNSLLEHGALKENGQFETSEYIGLEQEPTYDLDEPRDVARQRAQTVAIYGRKPSINDTSSEEDSDDETTRTSKRLWY
ncbi:hypothetical protein CkaCkLH20_04563 [Colletotrichum karsti]|uniref:CCHC-type domain-containing protein n=1 Tax=Colletotrichum karsti TaxID=1095194 RepID=A0A9P6I918_9PEZI|nr:uncharacterized protein CkaCkLH20_04563 [Colletotrichum karsti]KAF9877987.1 hypothetical protein CkaCkLH20_04563 [Colletotrichum karsti]